MAKNTRELFTPEQDAIDSYFECITECSLDNKGGAECITRCIEVHLKKED